MRIGKLNIAAWLKVRHWINKKEGLDKKKVMHYFYLRHTLRNNNLLNDDYKAHLRCTNQIDKEKEEKKVRYALITDLPLKK
jgi:hypothetical protein